MTVRTAFAIVALWCAVLGGCTSLRPQWVQLAGAAGLESRWIHTQRFRHRLLSNHVTGSHLRIYVEGDGSPWIHRNRVSRDPTPANPVLLQLMHRADHAAAYLGRPCYFGAASDATCGPQWWTFDRYSRPVVESMCDAANTLIVEKNADTVQLIGYSGGGAIVVAMKTCTDRLVEITTIAGNLSPHSWAQHHGYSPLNDADWIENAGKGSSGIRETHWQCESDTVVPAATTDSYFVGRPGATRRILTGCTHATGWERAWRFILQPDLTDNSLP